MPRVTMNTIAAGPNGTANPGDTIEVDTKTAKDLKDGGFALDADAADEAPSARFRGKKKPRLAAKAAAETAAAAGAPETTANPNANPDADPDATVDGAPATPAAAD